MALAMTYDEAKGYEARREIGAAGSGKGVMMTRFFGSRSTPDQPHARLSQRKPGEVSRVHFHKVDQFQVFVAGKGKLGRHELTPYCVHFSRAYTPYGPFSSDAGTGLTYLVLRPHFDSGAQFCLNELKQIPDRQPGQCTRAFKFPVPQAGAVAEGYALDAISGIKDELGLAAYTLTMNPNAFVSAPDPSQGGGQYLLVVKGSLLYDDREHKAYALVFVFPHEGPLQIRAGSEGLEGLILNFPRSKTGKIAQPQVMQAATNFKTWQCTQCGTVYDEATGMPEDGIAPGTRWRDVPETWNCPDCNASKADFHASNI